MIVKIVTFFLIGMAVLAMFGKLRVPKIGKRGGKILGARETQKCKHCGSYKIGKGPCPCRKKG